MNSLRPALHRLLVLRRLFCVLVLGLWCSSAVAQKTGTIDLGDWRVWLDQNHKDLQQRATRTDNFLQGGNDQQKERQRQSIKLNAAQQLQVMIGQVEATKNMAAMFNPRDVAAGDFRIGVLLSDLGMAFDTPGTQSQRRAALDTAVVTLARHVGTESNAPLAFAQAVHRLAQFHEKQSKNTPMLSETLVRALLHLKEKKQAQAANSLVQHWFWTFGNEATYPAIGRVASIVMGTPANIELCSAKWLKSKIDTAAKFDQQGKKELARKTAMEAARGEAESMRFMCFSHRLTYNYRETVGLSEIDIKNLDRMIGELSLQRHKVSLAQNYLFFKRTYSPEAPRVEQDTVETQLATIGVLGSLDEFRSALIASSELGDAFKEASKRSRHPADLARDLAEWRANWKDYAVAEQLYEKLRLIRPSKDSATSGWGNPADAIAAARFHYEFGKRSRATELARAVIAGFPNARLTVDDRLAAQLILARNALNEGDQAGFSDFIAYLIAEVPNAKDQVFSSEFLEVLRSGKAFLDTQAVGKIRQGLEKLVVQSRTLAQSMRRMSDIDRSRAGDKLRPQISFVEGVSAQLGFIDLFTIAQSEFSELRFGFSAGHLSELIQENEFYNSYKTSEFKEKVWNTKQCGEKIEYLLMIFAKREFQKLSEFYGRDKTIQSNDDCMDQRWDLLKYLSLTRASGQKPDRKILDRLVGDPESGGNTWYGVENAAIQHLGRGVEWLALGEPYVAKLHIEKVIDELVGAIDRQDGYSGDTARRRETAEWMSALAKARLLSDDPAGAATAADKATAIVKVRLERQGSTVDRTREIARFRSVLDTHVLIAATQPNEPTIASALEAAQLAHATSTSTTTARLAARLSAADPVLAKLLRVRQDAADTVEQWGKQLEGTRDKQEADKRRAREGLVKAQSAFANIDKELKQKYPRYAKDEDQAPASLQAIRDALAPDEVLLLSHSSPDAVFLFAISKSESRLVKVDGTRAEIDALIKNLREGFEVNDGRLPPFRIEAAHGLYKRFIAPLLTILEGKSHLTIVADGPLESLPFAVLTESANDEKPAYLIQKFSISHLPSARALIDLKALKVDIRQPESFLGVGDPVLGPPGDKRQGVAMARLVTRSAAERVDAIRKMQSLPDTAQQLRDMSKLLNGREEDLLLGENARQSRFRALDLGRFKVITFATHALVAGEISGINEPGIILTPEGTDQLTDGFLSASEVATLSLNADMVILSACNTAAPDQRPGAEGLSGLARSFIGAGAKSLVVSHWPVVSDATSALMTSFASELSAGAPPASAMRNAMLARLAAAKDEHEAHPGLWAPFFVVGVGR